jgi:dTDP-4-dehydrorhamnose 3,5-epimerase-like enzyme
MIKTVDDVRMINFSSYTESDIGWGTLVPLEFNRDIPFDVKRIFSVYAVDSKQHRGLHAHYKTQQVLICVNGRCGVVCKDGTNSKSFLLDSPSVGLYIPEMIWDEQVYMSYDTVLLVLASTNYNRKDYIESWSEYLKVQEG